MTEVEQSKESKRYVSLEDLCGEVPERDQAETFLPRYDGYVKHRTRVPLDLLLKFQERFMSGKRKDVSGFFAALLQYLLLSPRVDPAQAQLLMKADGRVMLEIVNGAVGDIASMAQESEDEAGE